MYLKYFALFFLFKTLIFSQFCFSQEITFRVSGMSGKILLEKNFEITSGQNLGQASHSFLSLAIKKEELNQYQGSESGVNSIYDLGSALEVISNTEMKAYGWCYEVDGLISDLLADQYELTGEEKVVHWFYAYAYWHNNRWKSMCVPAGF